MRLNRLGLALHMFSRVSFMAAVLFQTPQFLLRYRLESNNFAFMRLMGKMFTYPQVPSKFMIEKYLESWSGENALEPTINWYRNALQRRPTPIDKIIDSPLLILWGVEDRALSVLGARASVKYCSNCVLKEFEGIGHFVQHAMPDVVSREAFEFFAKR